MEFITLKYKVDTDLVDDPEKEQLFTLTFLEKLMEVYEKILEHLTPIEMTLLRNDEDNEIKNLITVHVKCSISEKKTDFDVDDLINQALNSKN
jgi:hypothetical protein